MRKQRPVQRELLPPLMVSFAVTRQCNLRCKHCSCGGTDSPHQQELSTEEAKRAISEIAETGARILILEGGEPLMRPDIYELVSWGRDRGLHVLLGTNATLLSTEALNKLIKAGVESIAVTLYGTSALSHESFSGREGSWDRTMAGIRNLGTAGMPFQINTCAYRGNVAEFDGLVDLAKRHGAKAVEVFDFMPVGRGKDNADLALTASERHDFVQRIVARQLKEEDLVFRCIGLPQLMVEMEKTIPDAEGRRHFARDCCGAGLRFCYVLYEGTVYPCPLLQKRAGNVREKSFQEIWQESDVFKTLRSRDKLGGKCKKCIYRYRCGGARCLVFAKTGSLNKEDAYCWFKTKEELQKAPEAQQAPCLYCGRQELVACEVCGAPLCEEHSLYCPLCRVPVCHPDVKDCYFRHSCSGADEQGG